MTAALAPAADGRIDDVPHALLRHGESVVAEHDPPAEGFATGPVRLSLRVVGTTCRRRLPGAIAHARATVPAALAALPAWHAARVAGRSRQPAPAAGPEGAGPSGAQPAAGTGARVISVIIPCSSMARFLPDAVGAIRRQAAAVQEIVIVDDGLDPDTGATCAALADAGAPTRLIHTDPCHPGVARNHGLAAARGDVIGFLDADDLWPAGKLMRQCARLDDDPAMEMVSGHTTYFDRLDPDRHVRVARAAILRRRAAQPA